MDPICGFGVESNAEDEGHGCFVLEVLCGVGPLAKGRIRKKQFGSVGKGGFCIVGLEGDEQKMYERGGWLCTSS